MVEPFLFRFKTKCKSRNNYSFPDNIYYDLDREMIFIKKDNKRIPVIESNDDYSFGTKKGDIEKGEDQKDTLLWNV